MKIKKNISVHISSRDQLESLQCFWFRPCPPQFKSKYRHRCEYLKHETNTDTDSVTELVCVGCHAMNCFPIPGVFLLHEQWSYEHSRST